MANKDPLFDNQDDEDLQEKDYQELRKNVEIIMDKLTGKNADKITLEDIAQYIRVINFNFIALYTVINRIVMMHTEMFTGQTEILQSLEKFNKQLQDFFQTNSFLDETLDNKKDKDDKS
jgi:hypothetical protein